MTTPPTVGRFEFGWWMPARQIVTVRPSTVRDTSTRRRSKPFSWDRNQAGSLVEKSSPTLLAERVTIRTNVNRSRLWGWPLHTSLLAGINNRVQATKRKAYGRRDDEHFLLNIRAAFPGYARRRGRVWTDKAQPQGDPTYL